MRNMTVRLSCTKVLCRLQGGSVEHSSALYCTVQYTAAVRNMLVRPSCTKALCRERKMHSTVSPA